MWSKFLKKWNGVSIFLDPFVTKASDLEIFTDSSGKIGFSGFFKGHYFLERWPIHLRVDSGNHVSMAFLELIPIVTAALLWGHNWHSKRILFHCDNLATVHAIRKGRSGCKPINHLMRILVLRAAELNFHFTAEWLSTKHNGIADALSRFDLQRFRILAPDADPEPTTIPAEILEILTT